jgi:hypothetical protein
MMFSSSVHLLASGKISFFFVAPKNSSVYKYHMKNRTKTPQKIQDGD